MATEKKEVHPVTGKDVQKKDKGKPKAGGHRPVRKANFKKTVVAIGHFFRDVWFELKKVTWPTRKEFISYSVAVLVFVAVFGAIIFAMDTVLGAGVQYFLIS